MVNDTHCAGRECGAFLLILVRQMKRHGKVAFCLHLGDITDLGQKEHLAQARREFGRLGCPFYPVIGNHDYATPTDRSAYEAVFPDRLNYTFQHQGWQFIGLDTAEGQQYEQTRVQPATFAFLDRELPRLEARKPMVLFTHFPLGAEVKYRPLNADELLERFASFNLRGAFGGHWHGYTESLWHGAPLVTNRCCSRVRNNHDGTKEEGYWFCRVESGVLSREFVLYRGIAV